MSTAVLERERLLLTRNDIPAAARGELIGLLNRRLADGIDLQTQAKMAHWNVKGTGFVALHELFDTVYGSVGQAVDLIAERAVQLGGVAEGTVRIVARRSELPEYPDPAGMERVHVAALADALAAFGARTRRAIDEATTIGDAVTADLFTGICRDVDKALWMVESHLPAHPI